jgi:hypothetical protein
MPSTERERFYYKLGIDLQKNTDPSVPDLNFFRLLGIDENLTDANVTSIVKDAYDSQFDKIKLYGHIDRAEAGEAQANLTKGKLALENPAKINEHREELYRIRFEKLKEYVGGSLHGVGIPQSTAEKLTRKEAAKLGFPNQHLTRAVNEAMGLFKWPSGPVGSDATGAGHGTPARKIPDKVWKLVWIPAIVVLLVGLLNWFAGFIFGLAGTFAATWLAYRLQKKQILMPMAISCATGILLTLLWGNRGAVESSMVGGRLVPDIIKIMKPKFPDDVPAGRFLAKPVYISSYAFEGIENSTLDLAVDAKPNTAWVSNSLQDEAWLEIGFGEIRLIDGLAVMSVATDSSNGNILKSFPVNLVFDEGTPIRISIKDSEAWQIIPFERRKTEKIRLIVNTVDKGQNDFVFRINEIWYYRVASLESSDNWAGTWSTSNFGNLRLEQHGNWVMGEYPGGTIVAKVVSKEELFGTWYLQATEKSGDIRLLISPNGKSFQGIWRSGSDPEEPWNTDTPWSGKRIKP